MIENARERWHDSLGCEGNQVKYNIWVFSRRKDYRENLFSVLIENLNPKVDAVCLWGVFKIFGKVSDVYLSPKKSSGRSSFSFIHFKMKEAAKRVVNKMNGMHIFGRLILSKIAPLGWKKMGWKQGVPIFMEGVIRKGE
ncbi:hypothetical protein Ddye_020540 [Dipteronia dyeriana]|uniref:RRM domain-containing protein n=1 Tax=Dipteronia dyeriana TaxID=168575 RepID=A0AAD9WX54_9ROSI|nr:hypothetical protein Ddye_020540 [Dipteronia dyeriana]